VNLLRRRAATPSGAIDAALRSEKNEYLPVRKFACAVREFSRFLPSLKNRGFSTI